LSLNLESLFQTPQIQEEPNIAEDIIFKTISKIKTLILKNY
ncbi:unnamed protein product, partial [marine sediment metagenome]